MTERFAKLKKVCQLLGYHGICPEALEELEALEHERQEFMHGMRRLFFSEEEAQAIEERNRR